MKEAQTFSKKLAVKFVNLLGNSYRQRRSLVREKVHGLRHCSNER